MRQANSDDRCAGVVTWCHTFSPSKMWIHGFNLLQKPYCHFATQYNRNIPNEEIDMDFMNLNQAAHGDREHGFIGARMRLPRKVDGGLLAGRAGPAGAGRTGCAPLWATPSPRSWWWCASATTCGTWLSPRATRWRPRSSWAGRWTTGRWATWWRSWTAVTEAEIAGQVWRSTWSAMSLATDDLETVRYQAREEVAMRKILDAGGGQGLHQQLPGPLRHAPAPRHGQPEHDGRRHTATAARATGRWPP